MHTALAWFLDNGSTCTWHAGGVDASGAVVTTATIATFPTGCALPPMVAVHGGRALVTIETTTWLVTLADGHLTRLPPTPLHVPQHGFTTAGEVAVHGYRMDPKVDAAARRHVERIDQGLPDGAEIDIAVSMVRTDTGWRTVRQIRTTTGYCGADHLGSLPPLARQASYEPAPRLRPASPAEAATLAPHTPPHEYEAEWRVVDGVAQCFDLGDGEYPLRPVLVRRGDGWARIDEALPTSVSPWLTAHPLGADVLLVHEGRTFALVHAADGTVHPLPARALSVTADPR